MLMSLGITSDGSSCSSHTVKLYKFSTTVKRPLASKYKANRKVAIFQAADTNEELTVNTCFSKGMLFLNALRL